MGTDENRARVDNLSFPIDCPSCGDEYVVVMARVRWCSTCGTICRGASTHITSVPQATQRAVQERDAARAETKRWLSRFVKVADACADGAGDWCPWCCNGSTRDHLDDCPFEAARTEIS